MGMDFLSVELIPEATAMGGAYVAAVEGIESVFWNVAGIANVKYQGFYGGYVPWLVNTHIPFVSYVRNTGLWGNFGIFLSGVSSPDFQVATEDEGLLDETFNYNAVQIGVVYSRYYTDKFSAGVSVKYIQENFGDFSSAKTIAIDAGSIFHTGFRSLRIAMSFSNLGPEVKPSGTYYQYQTEVYEEYNSYPLPVIFRLGAAMEIVDNPGMRTTLSLELVHPNDYLESFRIGLRTLLVNSVIISIGHRIYLGDVDKDGMFSEGGFSAGIGLKFRYIGFNYSYSEMGSLPDIHRFSIFYSL
jgi:hypothetical protein